MSGSWHAEYLSRVAYELVPAHAPHGFRAEPDLAGSDGYGCDTCGDAWASVSVTGQCPCGERVHGSVNSIEDVVKFMRDVTK